MSSTSSNTFTYTTEDVENVFRRFRADIFMIADSSGAITRSKAEDYAHDMDYLATRGYLEKIDLTLLSDGVELRAAVYRVNDKVGDTASARPGGVMWPRVEGAWLRITISYTDTYTAEKKEQTKSKLRIAWSSSTTDTSHLKLSESDSRLYSSNGYGLDRKDFR